MSRDRTDPARDRPQDGAAGEALNAYLDALANGGRSPNDVARALDPGLIAADRRLRALDATDGPPTGAKKKIWRDLMATMPIALAPAPPRVGMNGRAATGPSVSAPIAAERRRGWRLVPAIEIAAAILLLVGFAGLLGVLRERGESDGDLAAVASPVAVGSPAATVPPVLLRIEGMEIDATIEPIAGFELGLPFTTGPWGVGWDHESASLNEPGNVVLFGHVDYWDVGPAVFWRLRNLAPGARIEVIGADGRSYAYVVSDGQTYPAENLPPESVDAIVGPTEEQRLTLITETGEFDYERGEYTEVLVVRATLVDVADAEAAADGTPVGLGGGAVAPRTASSIARRHS